MRSKRPFELHAKETRPGLREELSDFRVHAESLGGEDTTSNYMADKEKELFIVVAESLADELAAKAEEMGLEVSYDYLYTREEMERDIPVPGSF